MGHVEMTQTLDEAVSREILFQPLEIFLGGPTGNLGVQPAGGKTFNTKRGGSNQAFLLEVDDEKTVIPHSITRGHNTSVGNLHVLSRPYPVDRFGASEEGWPNFCAGEIAHYLRHP
jgi:hypothetical protein